MNSPLKYDILGYTGGIAKVNYGLINFDFPEETLVIKGCRPFSDTCMMKILFLVCLPLFNENDLNSKLEEDLIVKFRSLDKSQFTVQSFFDDLIKSYDKLQCQPKLSIIKSEIHHQRAFYKSPSATFTTSEMKFENKLLMMGIIIRMNTNYLTYETVHECSIFVQNVKKNSLVRCFNESIIKITKINDLVTFLRIWTIWAEVECINSKADDDCSPQCIKSFRNTCVNGEELCRNSYVKVPVEVNYFTKSNNGQTKTIIQKIEERCFYFNPCLTKTLCPNQNCYTVNNGTYQCSSFFVTISNSFTDQMFAYNYVQPSSKLICNLEKKDLTINCNVIWKVIKNIYSVEIVSGDTLKVVDEPDYDNTLELNCQVEFSKYSPPFMSYSNFTIYKPPTKITFNVKPNSYIYTNQKIDCWSDGYPKTIFKISFNVPTKNFMIDSVSSNKKHLIIPIMAKLGPISIECGLGYYVTNSYDIRISNNSNFTLAHITNFNWGNEMQIIYHGVTLTCQVKTHLIERFLILQLEGPSMLASYNTTNYDIDLTINGGFYRILCVFFAIKELGIIYYRHYGFYLYVKPNYSCIFPMPGQNRMKLYCLHNGYPVDNGIATLTIKKFLQSTLISTQTYHNNRIIISYDGFIFDYYLDCEILFEDIFLKLNFGFKLTSQDGILLRGSDIKSQMCNDYVLRMNGLEHSQRFWVQSSSELFFSEFKICLTFYCLANFIAVLFVLIHMYALDHDLVVESTVNSMSRRHCVMRLYKKLNEMALFKVKKSRHANLDSLRNKFEAYIVQEEDPNEASWFDMQKQKLKDKHFSKIKSKKEETAFNTIK